MTILPTLEPPMPERCSLRQAHQWAVDGIKPVPRDFEIINPDIELVIDLTTVRAIYAACLGRAINLGGELRRGAFGREQIPVERIAMVRLQGFDFSRNILSTGLLTNPKDEWRYDRVDMSTVELFGVFPPSEPTKPTTVNITDDISSAQLQRSTQLPLPSSKPVTPVGAPAKFKWDEIWFHTMAFVDEMGLPETQAALVRIVQQICAENELGEPDESTLKPKIRRLFEIFRQDEKRWS
jgi:hypothetical protein